MLGGHYLRRNHSVRTPSRLVFVDTESWIRTDPARPDVQLNTFRLGVAVMVTQAKGETQTREVYRFKHIEEFWRILWKFGSGKATTWIYAHNIGYDLTMLGFWDKLEKGEYSLKETRAPRPSRSDPGKMAWPRRGYAVLEDPPVIIKAFDGDGQAFMFCDTYNYFTVPLAQMGQDVGLPKLDASFETDDTATLFNYCERDVEIIERAVLGLIGTVHQLGLGVWKATGPALAMAAYRHQFMPEKQRIIIEPNGQSKRIARAAYYGGEVKCGYYGRIGTPAEGVEENPYSPTRTPFRAGPVHVLDVTAAYPAIMHTFPYPYRLDQILRNPEVESIRRLTGHFIGVAVCQLNSPYRAYPRRIDGDTQYQTGQFWTGLAGNELVSALAQGDVTRIAACSLYSPAYLFRDFVDYFWEMRCKAKEEENQTQAAMLKLLMNGLYGKFGQRSATWEEVPDAACSVPWGVFYAPDPETGEQQCWRAIGWHAQIYRGEGEHPESCPAIAACVTANLRVHMRQLRGIAGEENVYYQDTDSLHVNTAGYDRLYAAGRIGDGEIGMLRVVEHADEAEYRGPRNYTLGERPVIAGLKSHATQIAPGQYSQKQFQRTRTIITAKPSLAIEVSNAIFTVRESLAHGIWATDGTVKPRCVIDPNLSPELADSLRPEEVPHHGTGDERQKRVEPRH